MTTDIRLNKILSLAPLIASQIFQNKPVTRYNLVQFCAALVEKYKDENLTSVEKLELAKALVPLVIAYLEESKMITPEQARKFKKLSKHQDDIVDIIEVLISVANNPNLLNLGKWKEKTIKCWFACCRK